MAYTSAQKLKPKTVYRHELRPYVVEWNANHSMANFKILYDVEFMPNVNPLYRVWRIFKHTCIDGLYKRIEADEFWYLKE